jgi:hypothetical protein
VIKRRDYFIDDTVSIGGDAPKDFIRMYQYGKARRRNRRKWTAYIAKAGHKWYPTESITEHLLNRIGQTLGFRMADSSLRIAGGQLRFLSTYFLSPGAQELVHGADIYAGYLADKEFVDIVETQRLAREFFTFQFAEKAILDMFPANAETLLFAFVQVLFFDAIIGNNDRHFYNWGVIRTIRGTKLPVFAPVYDTARGLFWNEREEQVQRRVKEGAQQPSSLRTFLERYTTKSLPKTGWEDDPGTLNHFQLAEHLCRHNTTYLTFLIGILHEEQEKRILQMIDMEFSRLLSIERIFLVKECLKYRFHILRTMTTMIGQQ